MTIKFIDYKSENNPHKGSFKTDYGVILTFEQLFLKEGAGYDIDWLCVNPKRNRAYNHKACHASLYGVDGDTHLVTDLGLCADAALRKQKHAFWLDILGPDSPYQHVIKDPVIYTSGEGDKLEMLAVQLAVDDTTSSQVMGNFCIATRIPHEKYAQLLLYTKLREDGIGVADALWVIGQFGLMQGGLCSYYPGDIGHFPFVGATVSRDLLNKKQPNYNKAQLYTRGDSYRPCSVIWDIKDSYPYNTKFVELCLKLSAGQKKESKRVFAQPTPNLRIKQGTYDSIIQALKETPYV